VSENANYDKFAKTNIFISYLFLSISIPMFTSIIDRLPSGACLSC